MGVPYKNRKGMEGLVGLVVFAPMPCVLTVHPLSHPHFYPSLLKHERLQATVPQSAPRNVGLSPYTPAPPLGILLRVVAPPFLCPVALKQPLYSLQGPQDTSHRSLQAALLI